MFGVLFYAQMFYAGLAGAAAPPPVVLTPDDVHPITGRPWAIVAAEKGWDDVMGTSTAWATVWAERRWDDVSGTNTPWPPVKGVR